MILNGKSEVDFIKWASYNYGEDSGDLTMLREVYRNALIIEFFDSVGIYIYLETGTYFNKPNFRYEIITNNDTCIGYKESSRLEATIQAIKKANDIYNERTNRTEKRW